MDEREITIVKGGRETPFSRGILAQTLAQAGAKAELAHRIASEVRAELLAEQRFLVEEEEVLARVRAKLRSPMLSPSRCWTNGAFCASPRSR